MDGVNPEIRNRIRLSVAAYAYEFESDPIMSDAEFDALAGEIEDWEPTGNQVMDEFFRDEFLPDTGLWVHKHPDIEGLRRIYRQVYAGKGSGTPQDVLDAIEELV